MTKDRKVSELDERETGDMMGSRLAISGGGRKKCAKETRK